jgi:predicted RNase H-like HicB family nuclease
MSQRYEYIATFLHCDEGITVHFLDVPACITQGDDMEEARYMAKDALYSLLSCTDERPEPSKMEEMEAKEAAYQAEFDDDDYGWKNIVVHKIEFEPVAVEV